MVIDDLTLAVAFERFKTVAGQIQKIEGTLPLFKFTFDLPQFGRETRADQAEKRSSQASLRLWTMPGISTLSGAPTHMPVPYSSLKILRAMVTLWISEAPS